MTAANVMDIISRLPGCAGQAADAISACTQVNWRTLQNCSEFRNVQTFGYAFHDTDVLNHGQTLKTPNWECLFVHRKQGLFLSINVGDKMSGKKQNMAPVEEINERR